MVTSRQRNIFNEILEAELAELHPDLRALLEEVPVVVEDEPTDELLEEMEIDRRDTDLCGLHSGIPLTQRSMEQSGTVPDQIMLFRGPIMRLARDECDDRREAGESALKQHAVLRGQIRKTLLHEIGHHFGLNEEDLERLGYG